MSKIMSAINCILKNTKDNFCNGSHFAGILVGDKILSCRKNTYDVHAEIASLLSYIKDRHT